MDAASVLRRLAGAVQAELDELYRVAGTPAPHSALDQEGLRNGLEIVEDYLEHNEWGLAFEHLIYMIEEPDLALSHAQLHELTALGRQLGQPEHGWSRIRTK